MKSERTDLPPIDNRLLNQAIRTAVEASHAALFKTLQGLRADIETVRRTERPNVTIIPAAPMPTPVAGAICMVIDEGMLYYADMTPAWQPLIDNAVLGGRPYRTLTLAPVDCLAPGRTQADFVCDGTADDVQLQAAIDLLTTGGGIVILDGTLALAAAVTLPSNVSIVGMGMGITTLTSAADAIFAGDAIGNLLLSDLSLVSGGWRSVLLQQASDCVLSRLAITGGVEGIAIVDARRCIIEDCAFTLCTGAAIALGRAEQSFITGNNIDACGRGVVVGG